SADYGAGRDASFSSGAAGVPNTRGTEAGERATALGLSEPEGDVGRTTKHLQPESKLSGSPTQGGSSMGSGYLGAIQAGGPSFAGQAVWGRALGVQVSRTDGTTARISGANTKSLTELTQAFPVQVIDPGVHKLVEEGGHRRRRWMDWAVFHVEPGFADTWVRYARAVKQRNAALRHQPAQAHIWNAEVARLGELIAE